MAIFAKPAATDFGSASHDEAWEKIGLKAKATISGIKLPQIGLTLEERALLSPADQPSPKELKKLPRWKEIFDPGCTQDDFRFDVPNQPNLDGLSGWRYHTEAGLTKPR